MQIKDISIDYLEDLRKSSEYNLRTKYEMFFRMTTAMLMEMCNTFLSFPKDRNHIVVMSWRTPTLLLGFSPLTWSSSTFEMYNLSNKDVETGYSFPIDIDEEQLL